MMDVNFLLEITAKKIAEYLVKCGEISNNDYEVEYYRYGIEVALSSLLNLAIIIIIGIISMHIIESLIFLIVFIFVRQVTGGYHADTYFKCNLYLCLSFVLLLISYDFFSNNNNVYLVTAINIVSLLIISIFSPVENKNKPIAKANRKGLKIKIYCIFYYYKYYFNYFTLQINKVWFNITFDIVVDFNVNNSGKTQRKEGTDI